MAAPGANVIVTEITTSVKAPQEERSMANKEMWIDLAEITARDASSPPVATLEEKENSDPDLVQQALERAEQEADAQQAAKHAEDALLREVSPAISEGSMDGECCGAQNGPAAAGGKGPSSAAAGGNRKTKKKEDKGIEHILKALNSLETPEEKLAALCKKYADLHEEHRGMKLKFKQSQHKLTGALREKDHLQTEHSKSILAKSKLESLCRELQRHNKLIKDESYARAREEEEKRKEVTNKFQQTINDIQQQMNDHYTKNTKLREENVDLANKLKTLIEQYEQREQHIEKVLKHKELEQQLVDARLQQANLKISEEKERATQEKNFLLTEAAEANKKVQLLEEQEKALRAQVGLYTEKYEEFQQTLSKSNEVFSSFKVEMDKMTKKIKKLEKETHMWKQRWENSNLALAQMADEKTKNDRENALLMSKVKKLESLCRALQQERNKGTAPSGDAVGSSTVTVAGPAEQLVSSSPAREPASKPAVEPAAGPASEPAAEPMVEPVAEPAEKPAAEPASDTASAPVVEPAAEQASCPASCPGSEPMVEPAAEPMVEPAAEQASCPASCPGSEPMVEPTMEPAAEPMVEPVAEPASDTVSEPVVEPAAEPVVEPAAEQASDPASEPVVESAAEPAPEASAELQVEAEGSAASPEVEPPAAAVLEVASLSDDTQQQAEAPTAVVDVPSSETGENQSVMEPSEPSATSQPTETVVTA